MRAVSMRIWWWSVANRWAMRSEYRNSSPATSPTDSKPIEKVGQPGLAGFGQQTDDQAGVHPAGQQAADRDVGHQPALRPPAVSESRTASSQSLFGPAGAVVVPGEVGLPVGDGAPAAVRFENQQGGRRQLA